MNKIHFAIAISLITGFAVAAVAFRVMEFDSTNTNNNSSFLFSSRASTEQRIKVLEDALTKESNARQLLEEHLLVLYAELDTLRDQPEPPFSQEKFSENEKVSEENNKLSNEKPSRRIRVTDTSELRSTALMESGFTPDRAEWITQREDEIRIDVMQLRFDARRSGDMQALFSTSNRVESMLRNEIGDIEYEQYLQAYGSPTTIRIGTVMESSPGQLAGLRPDDEIVSYDGKRVFSFSDLTSQQMQGEAGESVVMDILRDDVPMQIVLPRGPIGIQRGRYGR